MLVLSSLVGDGRNLVGAVVMQRTHKAWSSWFVLRPLLCLRSSLVRHRVRVLVCRSRQDPASPLARSSATRGAVRTHFHRTPILGGLRRNRRAALECVPAPNTCPESVPRVCAASGCPERVPRVRFDFAPPPVSERQPGAKHKIKADVVVNHGLGTCNWTNIGPAGVAKRDGSRPGTFKPPPPADSRFPNIGYLQKFLLTPKCRRSCIF